MKRLIYITALMIGLPFLVHAQNIADVLRYSNQEIQGTARSAAMGNAFGALGGDFTSLSINPAGVAVYRGNEFTISAAVSNTKVDALYQGVNNNDDKYRLNFNNLGYVANIPASMSNETGLVSINLGVGFNRLNNFNQNLLVSKSNVDGNSILDYFTDMANTIGNSNNFNPHYEGLAWQTGVVLFDEDNDEFFNDIRDAGYGQTLTRTTSRKGGINEYVFSVGANFNHTVYLGMTLGIQDLYYKETFLHHEYDANEDIPFFIDTKYDGYLRTSGTGYNVKVGAIIKPTNDLRLGVAVHTPTFFELNDRYSHYMISVVEEEDGSVWEYTPEDNIRPTGDYDYDIRTPFKAVFSGAYIINKRGIISIDYEYVDYSTAKFRDGGDGYDFAAENSDIEAAYTSTGNLRVGGELRLNPNFSLRAGYEYFGNPYKSNAFGASQPNKDYSYSTYSAGLGFGSKSFYMDLAYKYADKEEYATIYNGSDIVKYDTTSGSVLLTLGFRF
ncbi:hypothetical protein EYV94_14195 [Puteibacter caeruleilacunae]|nr:hypothetical protein EYV94_14195 [Puteibacter caeruleilacunae]